MSLLNFSNFLNRPHFAKWKPDFSTILDGRWTSQKHGHLVEWLTIVDALPSLTANKIILDRDIISVDSDSAIDPDEKTHLTALLKSMSPWRKGPYNLFDVFIDTEWRSDWKWQRIAPYISNLKGRNVLDVGCGSGYHCWRMLGANANSVLGIDPTLRFYIQYLICQKYIRSTQFDFLPIGIEELPKNMAFFDTTFSMGVLYHRRDMQQHILELRDTLKEGGELVLETLIVDEDCKGLVNGVLVPEDRYAAMRNVWNIPTIQRLQDELNQAGFSDISCIEKNITSLDEQRKTDWINGYSLKEFLDANDISKTREGYPAPKRATFVAKKTNETPHPLTLDAC